MRKHGLLAVVLAAELIVFMAIEGPNITLLSSFLRYVSAYAQNLIAQSGPVLFLGFGMTIVLMTAGIDLSVGAMVALIACVMSVFSEGPTFWYTALPFGLALALALGCINGLLVARIDIPPIITTLGTMIFYRGFCYVVMGDRELAPFLSAPGYGVLGDFLPVTLLTAMLFLGGGYLFARSRWRQEILTIGGNRVAARYAGIPVARRQIQAYTLMGLLAFLAAVVFTARNGSVNAGVLAGLELQVIVAVVLGGTRVQGGSGSLSGAFLGVLIIAVLDEGLRSSAAWGDRYLPFRISHLQYILLGGLLVFGVWINARRKAKG